MRTRPAGQIAEVFSGVQGEGLWVGRRQIFIRLSGCNMACGYCDQPEAREASAMAAIERTAGRRDFVKIPNPMPAVAVERAVLQLHRPATLHHSVAVTGGEPLVQADFLARLLPGLRGRGLKALLETNGTLPDALRALLPCLDIVSMDLKLRSATGRPFPARAHERFLRVAVRHGVDIYAKAVIAATTSVREISRAAGLIARVKKSVPLILQPATPVAGGTIRPPDPDAALRLQETAARLLKDVRVIPQTHKIMGQY